MYFIFRVQFQSSINELYPDCIVYLFGSTVNGLGFKGCDIDAFMDLGKNLHRFLIFGYFCNISRIFLRPFIKAHMYALCPKSSIAFKLIFVISADFWIRYSTTLERPHLAAIKNPVAPSCFFDFSFKAKVFYCSVINHLTNDFISSTNSLSRYLVQNSTQG